MSADPARQAVDVKEETVSNDRIARGALGCIALFMTLTALQAAFFPRSFFDDFRLAAVGLPPRAAPTTNTSSATSACCSSH